MIPLLDVNGRQLADCKPGWCMVEKPLQPLLVVVERAWSPPSFHPVKKLVAHGCNRLVRDASDGVRINP